MTLRIALNGIPGRMAQRVAVACATTPDIELTLALARPGSLHHNQPLSSLAGFPALPLKISTELVSGQADVLIDFSNPTAALERARSCARLGLPMVLCSTGLTPAEDQELNVLAREIPLIATSNTSLGVNLLAALVQQVARSLGSDYDIEIVESHHRFKKDAPSGTALLLAGAAASGQNQNLSDHAIYGRHGREALRKPGEIGIHALRMGDVVGEHSVYFTTLGERLELTHRASSRDTFAQGSLRAARFLFNKTPGRYQMADVLGLH